MSENDAQIIYTDGSCIPNPGPGGYAFIVLEYKGKSLYREWHVSGGEEYSTNNQMELRAVIEALKFTHDKSHYRIYSDSTYVINCAQGKYKRKKNKNMWQEYDEVSQNKSIAWIWVRSHNGDKYNELVDGLAKKEAKLFKK